MYKCLNFHLFSTNLSKKTSQFLVSQTTWKKIQTTNPHYCIALHVLKISSDRSNRLYSEVIVCIFTLILLVWLMNREFEISYRLSYHCSKLSQRDRRKIQTLKNQADWLLHNIIPRYVVLYIII